MYRQRVVALLHNFDPLGSFSGGCGDQNGFEARLFQTGLNCLRESGCYVFVGDDRTAIAEFQFSTLPAQVAEQAGANLDFVTASAEGHINDTHAVRIEPALGVSIVRILALLSLNRRRQVNERQRDKAGGSPSRYSPSPSFGGTGSGLSFPFDNKRIA